MGLCYSCCGRRKTKTNDPERRPLLSADGTLPEAHNTLEQVADALAALRAGKLPSQTQLGGLIRALLRSDLMRVNVKAGSRGGLNAEQVKVVLDARLVLESIMQWGLDKNG